MQTVEELEQEIAEKKAQQLKQLQSPFATVGNASTKRGPGRPPKQELTYEDGAEAHEERLKQIKRLPENATEEESREHFNKELYSVLPDIAANLKWDVKFGGSKERSEAGTKVMRALGLESKDVGNIGKGGQIVINMNGPANTLDLPLLRPVMKTVESITADSNKKEDK
jgi:hypothetical protein